MARCQSTINSFVHEALLWLVIAALVLAYGNFGSISSNSSTAAHNAATASASAGEQDYHHHHHFKHEMVLFLISLLRFISDGFLGLVVATSLLAYGMFRHFVGSMVVMVNGCDSSIQSSSGNKSPPPQLVKVGSVSSFHSTLATISEEQEEEKSKQAVAVPLLRKNKIMHHFLARQAPLLPCAKLSNKSSINKSSHVPKSK